MLTKALFLSEDKIGEHLRGAELVQSLVGRALRVLKFFEPFENGSEWTMEGAIERLSKQEHLPRRPFKILRAACFVNRSLLGILSSRELVIDVIACICQPLQDVAEALCAHEQLREDEIAGERFLDQATKTRTVLTDEHEAAVRNDITAAVQLIRELLPVLERLSGRLGLERSPALETAYGMKGGAAAVEFATRLLRERLSAPLIVRLQCMVPAPNRKTATHLEKRLFKGKVEDEAARLRGRCAALKAVLDRADKQST